mgnify:CR=1 FL=1
MKIKYLPIYAAMLVSTLAILTACNDEWKEEQYTQYISFRAPLSKLGVTDVYVPYSRRNASLYRREFC